MLTKLEHLVFACIITFTSEFYTFGHFLLTGVFSFSLKNFFLCFSFLAWQVAVREREIWQHFFLFFKYDFPFYFII